MATALNPLDAIPFAFPALPVRTLFSYFALVSLFLLNIYNASASISIIVVEMVMEDREMAVMDRWEARFLEYVDARQSERLSADQLFGEFCDKHFNSLVSVQALRMRLSSKGIL